MKSYNVRFLQEALADLEEIVLYIAQDNHKAALRLHDAIVERAQDLTTFPKRGRLIPDRKMNAAGYRMLGIKPYVMFYRIINHDVFIYRVLHGATNYPLLYEKMLQTSDVLDLE